MNALALTIVLVHGAFVDGSGWEDVSKLLKKDGYSVSVVQHPTISLNDDVAFTKRVIDSAPGPVLLVGHSYGGVVITQAGNDPKVKGLVYVAAFAPEQGESVETLIKTPIPGAPVPPLLPPRDGFLLLDQTRFAAAFAPDIDAKKASFMAASQVPLGLAALGTPVSEAAWKVKPSYYMVTKDDLMIPPQAQRGMSQRMQANVVEVAGSHAVYMSQPKAVADLIKRAAREVAAKE